MKRQGANANKAGVPTSKTARSDSEDPFYLPHCESDVTLVVEDKELHVHKAVLSVHSPVFGAMFTADFAEKNAKKIPLPGKKYDAMLHFLEMMYPVHSLDPVPNDDVLLSILPLAEEYQSQHVRVKCEAYIGQQLKRRLVKPPSADKKLGYLLLCEQYRLEGEKLKLIGCCAELKLDDIVKSENFKNLTPTTQIELLKSRCHVVEGLLSDKEDEKKRTKMEVLNVCTLNALPTNRTCYECHTKLKTTCTACIENILKD